MRTIQVGSCVPAEILMLDDPHAPTEAEFEHSVVQALCCIYKNYKCVMFNGSFLFDERRYRPDLALIASDMSHWFVIEVELVSHSFEHHVLPQVRAFRYGEPQYDCAKSLAKEMGVDIGQAKTMLDFVPKGVVVVANKREGKWESALDALDIQLLVVSVFKSASGKIAFEVDGGLMVLKENLGFGKYSAVDRSLHFPPQLKLDVGQVVIDDSDGSVSLWTVVREARGVWITKKVGSLDLEDGETVQLIRTVDGRLIMHRRSV